MNGNGSLSKLPSCTALPTTKETRKSDSIKIVKITFDGPRQRQSMHNDNKVIPNLRHRIMPNRILLSCFDTCQSFYCCWCCLRGGRREQGIYCTFSHPTIESPILFKKFHENVHGCDENLKQISDQLEGHQLNTWLHQCSANGKCVTEVAFHDFVFLHARLTPAERLVSEMLLWKWHPEITETATVYP